MTALETIFRSRFPKWDQPIQEFIGFEAIPWMAVMTSAILGVNLNDHRFPNYKPSPEPTP